MTGSEYTQLWQGLDIHSYGRVWVYTAMTGSGYTQLWQGLSIHSYDGVWIYTVMAGYMVLS